MQAPTLQRRADVWIEAVLLKEDLAALVGQFTPVTLRLGDDGELRLGPARDVELVPEVGLRAVCEAHLRWSILGIAVPIHVPSLAVVLRPEVEATGAGQRLVFKVEIEHADVAGVPTVIDDRITEKINRELAARHVELAWDYADTLGHVFELPDLLQPLERLELRAAGARVKPTSEAVGLAIEFHARVLRGPVGAMTARVAAPMDRARPVRRPRRRGAAHLVMGALSLAAGALLGAFALGRATRG
jgi:hypothetical protein